jgi:drug/metabolite transporter (DMT)-like permease
VFFALIFFVPPNFLVLWAAQRIDSGRVGILLMTEVLAGAATAALFSGEAFGTMELAGTLLILCAGLVEVLGRR